MFCRKCGKEIGDSITCPNCGIDEQLSNSQNGVQYGAYGEIRTADGRGVYKTAGEALSAFNKICVFNKLRIIFSLFTALSFIIGLALSAISFFVSGYAEYSISSVFFIGLMIIFMWLASAFFIPAGIFDHMSLRALRDWITKNNIDCRATVKNEKAMPDKALIMATYIIENPEKKKRLNASKILMTIFFPLFFHFSGVWLAILSFCSQLISNALVEAELIFADATVFFFYPCVTSVLILMLIFNIPATIAGAGLKKKARENFYQNHA